MSARTDLKHGPINRKPAARAPIQGVGAVVLGAAVGVSFGALGGPLGSLLGGVVGAMVGCRWEAGRAPRK